MNGACALSPLLRLLLLLLCVHFTSARFFGGARRRNKRIRRRSMFRSCRVFSVSTPGVFCLLPHYLSSVCFYCRRYASVALSFLLFSFPPGCVFLGRFAFAKSLAPFLLGCCGRRVLLALYSLFFG